MPQRTYNGVKQIGFNNIYHMPNSVVRWEMKGWGLDAFGGIAMISISVLSCQQPNTQWNWQPFKHRCPLTNTGIFTINIRRSHDHLIVITEISIGKNTSVKLKWTRVVWQCIMHWPEFPLKFNGSIYYEFKLHHTQCCNKLFSQMRAPLAARRKPTGDQNRQPNVLYVFEH